MKKKTGILLVIVSAVLFGATSVLGRLSYEGGSNAYMLTLLRSLFALPVLLLIALVRRYPLRLPARQLRQMFLLNLFGSSLYAASLYSSYAYIPVGIATALHFSYPAVVIVSGAILQRRGLSRRSWVVLLLSMSGIAFFLDFSQKSEPTGIILALVSALSFAFYIQYQSVTGLSKLNPTVFCFYQALFVSGIMLVFTLASGSFTLSLTPLAYFYTFLVSILVAVVAFACLQKGIHVVGASTAAIFSLLEPVTSILVSMAVLGETMNGKTLIGCVLILSGLIVQSLRPGTAKQNTIPATTKPPDE